MRTRQFLCALVFLGVCNLAGEVVAAGPAGVASRRAPDKALVLDGHVVHDAGRILNHVSNWGLIGSMPDMPSPFADSPSAMWPGASGTEYLWAAGLWVGARDAEGTAHVTSGGFASEFLPTPAPADTIYPAARGAAGGNRYPWSGADDDGDGLEDEDLPNGRDDDGDGRIDEDFTAFGDQQFVSTYADTGAALMDMYPDHVPLGIRVVQRSIQWGGPLDQDYIGFDFTVTNIGTTPLSDVYLGLFSDGDIGPRGAQISGDDLAGYFDALVRTADGSWVPAQVAYMYNRPHVPPLEGYVGWILCDHTTDPSGATAPTTTAVRSFQCLSGNASFANGGDPTNDAESYQLLSAHTVDPNVPPEEPADYRTLMSSGPFPDLAPGASLTYRVALVLGADRDEMLANAGEAWLKCHGLRFDRDGDPGNGNEFHVPWLRAGDAPLAASPDLPAAVSASLEARPNPFNPLVTIDYALPVAGRARLEVFDLRGRRLRTLLDAEIPVGAGTLEWRGDDDRGRALASGVYELRLVSGTTRSSTRVTLLR